MKIDLIHVINSWIVFWEQDDQVVLQCTASVLKEQQIKLCLSCEGFGNRLCFLETTSNAQVRHWYPTSPSVCSACLFFLKSNFVLPPWCLQNVPPDLAICTFILEQSLSVRALQEMLANTVEMTEVGLQITLKGMSNGGIHGKAEMWKME